jgi:hypothetical protein
MIDRRMNVPASKLLRAEIQAIESTFMGWTANNNETKRARTLLLSNCNARMKVKIIFKRFNNKFVNLNQYGSIPPIL